jgi:hypothetical protein
VLGGGASTGNIHFLDTTIYTTTLGGPIVVEGTYNEEYNGIMGAKIRVEGNTGRVRLIGYALPEVHLYNNSAWDTAEWTTNEFGVPVVAFTNAQGLLDYMLNTFLAGYDKYIRINYGDWKYFSAGISSGTGGDFSFQLDPEDTPPTDPTTIDTFELKYQRESFIDLNSDDAIRINGTGLDVNIGSIGGTSINLETDSGQWTFGADGSLTFPSGAGFGLGDSNQLKVHDANTHSLDFRDATGRGFYTNSDGYTLRSNGTYNWIFGSDGTLSLPNAPSASAAVIQPNGTDFGIQLISNGNVWAFNTDGSVRFPQYSIQRDTATIVCNANSDTVVFTSYNDIMSTIKLLIKVEGAVTNSQPWDAQSCEMIIAKSWRANTVVASVYAVVHTSVEPLATFTAQWNATASRVEVLCRPTSSTYGVEVKTFVTEITTSD